MAEIFQKSSKGKLQIVLLALALLANLFANGTAYAYPIGYEFTIAFNTGTLSGQVFKGALEIEAPPDPPSTGITYCPDCPLYQMLSFEIEVGGYQFLMVDDVEFDTFPRAEFDTQGNLVLIDFAGVSESGTSIEDEPFGTYLRIEYSGSENFVGFGERFEITGGVDIEYFSTGVVTSTSRIPEPTILALLSLGLAGLGFTRRRMKA
jgi:hypothetical protein